MHRMWVRRSLIYLVKFRTSSLFSSFTVKKMTGTGRWDQRGVGSALDSATDLWSNFANIASPLWHCL